MTTIHTYAAQIRQLIRGPVSRHQRWAACQQVCGPIIDSLSATPTGTFRICVGKGSYGAGWLGVLIIDDGGNIFVEGTRPPEEFLGARYDVIMAELMLAEARRREDAINSRSNFVDITQDLLNTSLSEPLFTPDEPENLPPRTIAGWTTDLVTVSNEAMLATKH